MNPTPEQLAKLEPAQRELVDAAMRVGVADRRNTLAFVKHTVARAAWVRAQAEESERRRKARLEADPRRLALLKRAAAKRRRKAAKRTRDLAVSL